MECSIYVCPKCRRTYRIKGMDRNMKCADCEDAYLKDMHIDADLWKTFNLGKQTQAVDFALSSQNLSQNDTTADKGKSVCFSCGAPLSADVKFCPNCGEKNPVGETEDIKAASASDSIERNFADSNLANRNNEAKRAGDIKVYVEPERSRTSHTVIGIVSCVLAVIAFFANPTFLGLLLGLAALVMAVFALHKKCKLQGFPVITVIIESVVITVSIVAVLITQNINVLFDDSVLLSYINKGNSSADLYEESYSDYGNEDLYKPDETASSYSSQGAVNTDPEPDFNEYGYESEYKSTYDSGYDSAYESEYDYDYGSNYEESSPRYEYYLNLSTGVFHDPSCYKVSEIIDGEYVTSTYDEMISNGYKGCGICNPDKI